ncbi:Voltage-gated Ion Channel (VIC) Superfamily [Thraustotheca clavata]|uniref:Voltage-gated Ion Channel (VIC) Superfamily n=1 Tax=Thraustotheca clavata TaxID=74557 RepID=A0A1V9YV09_9STRA|nr:Voltage-gated Ion Channel (VIC) Superfamily [Thraustotheca clavata]
MLSPFGRFRRIWDSLLAFAVIYLCWYIPFNVALVWWSPSPWLSVLNSILDVIFVMDVFISFRTAIVVYGELIDDPMVVARYYMKSWFFIDFIAVFPVEWFVTLNSTSSTKSVKLLKYIKLPRLLRLSQLVRRFRRFQRYEGSFIIISAFIFSVHIAGCGWILIMQPCEVVTDSSPIQLQTFCDPSNAFEAYSLGFHHALAIMASMSLDCVFATTDPLSGGYRLTYLNATSLPSGLLEISNFLALFGILLGSIIISSSVFVVQSWNRAGYQFRKRLDIIHNEMEYLQLPAHLRNRVQMYHQYLWTHQGSATEKITLLQDEGMSEPLRKEIAIFMYRDLLSKIPLFRTASDQLLGMICLFLKTVIYLPKDIIITRGELGKDLFIIAKGSVVVLGEDALSTLLVQSNTDIPHDIVLKEGSFFGEIGLLMEIERTRTVVAQTICELGVLSKANFNRVMNQFPAFAIEIAKLMLQRKLGRVDLRELETKESTNEEESIPTPMIPEEQSIERRLDRIEALLVQLQKNA